MSLPSQIASDTVTRVRAVDGAPDAHGNVTKTWSDRLAIHGCHLEAIESVEFIEGRQTVIVQWRWFGPFDADVESVDRLEIDGDTFEVDGDVKKHHKIIRHKAANLKRVEE